ncbi:ABC transporter permease [Metamycoplasma buccale]|uniref:ABC transporter permease n=1 Tax=Metamycoplasma buccale TaxID=55602 RepID=UPI00398E9A17
MHRLFKEVFKSLSKNKVTLICLTILIFLTSGIFTLLFDIKTSYTKAINSYDTVSRIHDLTADLTANPSGIIPNGGFDQVDKDNKTIIRKPITFEADDTYKETTSTLHLPKEDQNFIKLKGKNWTTSNEEYYINSEEFMHFYYKSQDQSSGIKFDLLNKQFSFNFAKKEFQLYKKEGNKYIPVTKTISLNKTDTFSFNEEITLDKLGEIVHTQDVSKPDYIKNPVSWFINTKTKKVSRSLLDYEAWKKAGTLHVLSGAEFMKALGFKAVNGVWQFDSTTTGKGDIKFNGTPTSTTNKLVATDKLQNTFSLNTYLSNNTITTNEKQTISLEGNNKVYKLPEEWIRIKTVRYVYNWNRYRLNWDEIDDENRSNWKGSYYKFISQFKNSNPTTYRNLKYFSTWSKTKITTYKIGTAKEKVTEEQTSLNQKDLDVTFKTPWDGGKYDIYTGKEIVPPSSKKYNNIRQIEAPNTLQNQTLSSEEFSKFTDGKLLQQNQSIIRDGTANYARSYILNEIKKAVSEENLGIRQTMTVETVDEKTNNKNVHHFINTGDKDYKINGIKQNVGKLYNEQNNPTILNKSITDKNIDDFLLKPKPGDTTIKKIPSVYTKEIIKMIFQSYTPDFNYFAADIRYEDYYDFFKNTLIPRLKKEGKILALTTAEEESKDTGASLVGGIAMPEPDKYVFLTKDSIDGYNSKKVWKKAVLDNKEYYTLDELYEKLVKENWTIRGTIGPNGWAYVDPKYKNQITLPIAFGAINNELTSDIVQNKSIAKLVAAIKSAILQTELARLFNEDDLNKILDAFKKSIEANDLHTLLATGKVNKNIIIKVIFDAINNLIKSLDPSDVNINMNGNAFIKKIFKGIIDYFKKVYVDEYMKDDNKLVEQIQNLTNLLGLNKTYVIPSLKLTMLDLLKLVKNKEEIFEIFKQIIDSIDFMEFSKNIQDWYKEHPLIPFTSTTAKYWSLSSHRIILSFLKSVDSLKLKEAIIKLINEIDFDAILNPDKDGSYYSRLVKAKQEAGTPLSEADKTEIKNFFKKLNGSSNYSNINSGLTKIVQNINIEKFVSSLEKLIRQVKSEIIVNKKVYSDYNTEVLSAPDYLAAFLNSFATSPSDPNAIYGQIQNIQNAIIKMLNLSNKTMGSTELGFSIPGADPNKLSLLDLGTIGKAIPPTQKNDEDSQNPSFNAFNINDINKVLTKINTAINTNTKFEPTENELNFLKNSVLVNETELSNLKIIKTKLMAYLELIQKLKLENYGPDRTKITWNWKFDDDPNKQVKTYGDLAYRSALINKNANLAKQSTLTTLYKIMLDKFLSNMLGSNQESLIKNELSLFASWIKLGYEISNIADITKKIEIDPETGANKVINQKNRHLTLAMVSYILNELLKVAQMDEIKDILNNYSLVENTIPNNLLKVAYAHAANALAANLLTEKIKNGSAFNNFFSTLQSKGINADDVAKIKEILLKHSNELAYSFAYLSNAYQMPTFYKETIEEFVKSFIKSDSKNNNLSPLVSSNYDFDLLYKMTLENSKLPEILSLINVPRSIMNPLLSLTFPQVLMYYVLSNDSSEGNLAYVVKKLFSNLNNLTLDQIKNMVSPLYDKYEHNEGSLPEGSNTNVHLDLAKFNYLIEHKLKTHEGKDIKFFGINITNSFRTILYKIIEPITVYNSIAYSDAGSYLAKVNYGYLSKNNKEVYRGDLTEYLKDPIKMERLLKSLPDKYKVKVNSIEYLIIGTEMTADYLYPVVNESNLQVDTKNQSLVYVNTKGFDRMRSAYPTFAIKEYALIRAKRNAKGKFETNQTPKDLKEKFNNIINKVNSGSWNKVYLKNETDYLNPERSIRVTTVRTFVKTIENVTIYSVLLLILLVGFIVYFIIKRYIEARNKVIGILRAQGYTTKEIAISFCAYGWIPTAIGTLVGYFTGLALQGKIMNVFSSYWTHQTNVIPFHWLAMIFTVIIPLLLMSLLIYVITRISVRRKPTELMSGLVEVNISNLGQKISSIFRRWSIKYKYIISMALNNFWKMFSLFLAFSTTSLLSMFFLSSNNVFSKLINQTYKNRNYKYKLDLETPTTEGGPYVTYNKNTLRNLLYVPNDLAGQSSGNGSQLDYDNPNFLRPGNSFNTDTIPRKYDPTVITKSSLDLLLDLSVALSPWDITYANMPETQRARVVQIFKRVSREMESTQNIIKPDNWDGDYSKLISVKDIKKYYADKAAGKPEDLSNRKSFFTFTEPEYNDNTNPNSIAEQFRFVEWDAKNGTYLKAVKVTTSRHRQEYREFLLNAYKKIASLDFFVSFAGVYWNQNTNEKYTYAKAKINNKEYKIYGYRTDSKYVKLESKDGKNLTKTLADYKWDSKSKIIPLVVNQVVAKIFKLNVGSILEGDILNHIDRFSHKSLNLKGPLTKYKFQIVGISDTYINQEFVTRKDILDQVLGFDMLTKALMDARQDELNNLLNANPDKKAKIIKEFIKKYEAFNGILSVDKTPVQTIDTLTTYSSSGFWGAAATFDTINSNDDLVWAFFKRIFISDSKKKFTSVYEHAVKSYNDLHGTTLNYMDKILEFLDISKEAFDKIVESDVPIATFRKLARDALTRFYGPKNSIYGKDIMYGASFNVDSKDIEAGFVKGISSTVNTVLNAFIVISFIISIIILIVITNIMISSNQRAIATFSVLGYKNREKIFLFFFNFVPVILLACAFMIPVTYGLIALFNKFMITTSSVVLPMTLTGSSILLSAVMCLSVFTITSIAAWYSLNKVKAIDALKGK